MIPAGSTLLENDFTTENQPTYTHMMNFDRGVITGYVDEQEAMKQAIFKILSTERYQYVMYSWDYGIELADLYGEPISYVCPELERRITEALTWDDRIESVDNFDFKVLKKGEISVEFTVHTIFGDMTVEKVVNF